MGTWNGLGCWEPGALITIREDGKLNMLAVINGVSESKFFLGEFVTKFPPPPRMFLQKIIATSHDPQMVVYSKGNPLISGKSRLVKYYILANMICKNILWFRNYTTY